MSYWDLCNTYGADVDGPDPEDLARSWAREVGRDDGFNRGIEEEGLAALRGADTRAEYIEAYRDGFLERIELDLHRLGVTDAPFFDVILDMSVPRTDPDYGAFGKYTRGGRA